MKCIIPLLIVLVCSVSLSARADSGSSASSQYTVHLLTFGRGEDLFSRFGHIALVVDDHINESRRIYNFGTFDFSDPALQFKYARGFLNYWLSVELFGPMVDYYRKLDRDIWMHTLDLPAHKAEAVAERLRINALPDNRFYAYRHYLDNCCTRIRDIIDDAVDGALRNKTEAEHTGRTFRDWTRDSLAGLPVFQRIILYSLGPAIDYPLTRWEEQFLPEVLMADVEKLTLPDGRPLVSSVTRLNRRMGPDIGQVVPSQDKIVLGVLLLLLLSGMFIPAVFPGRPFATRLVGLGLASWGLFAGLGGLMLLLYWTATTHNDTHYNENLLVTPFTHLWLVVPGCMLLFKGTLSPKMSSLVKRYMIGALALCGVVLVLKVGPFIQFNYDVIVVSLLCNGLLFMSLRDKGAVRTG